jgi:hypothetical protein
MTFQSVQAVPGFDVPNPNGTIRRAGDYFLLIIAPVQADDIVGMALEYLDATPRFDVPKA